PAQCRGGCQGGNAANATTEADGNRKAPAHLHAGASPCGWGRRSAPVRLGLDVDALAAVWALGYGAVVSRPETRGHSALLAAGAKWLFVAAATIGVVRFKVVHQATCPATPRNSMEN